MTDGDRPSAQEISVAEPTEEISRGGPSRLRRPFAIVVVAVLCVAALAIPIALRSSSRTVPRRKANRATKHVDARRARIQVGAALAATLASGSYRIDSVMTETGTQPRGITLTAQATVNLDPPAMVATSDFGGSGITSWTDSTRQWEQGGGNYGLTAGSAMGPGQPISGFAPLVVGSLGRREGGMAMMSLSSPSGYLNIADQAITGASQIGTTTFNGSELTEYQVTLDASQLLHQPGMSSEQIKAATDGLSDLEQEGYTRTTIRLGVDDAGYVRTAHTVVSFADGGAVVTDVSYSDFGCAGTVVLPTQAPAPPPPATCTSPDPAATTPTAPDTTTPGSVSQTFRTG